MAMLATTGGSSIVAQALGQTLMANSHHFDIRYCHLRQDQLQHHHFLIDAAIGKKNSELLDTPASVGSNMDSVSELLRMHNQWSFELLHIHNIQVYGLAALMLKQLRNIPYIITFHGSDLLNNQLFDQNLEIAQHILRNAAAITCVSEYLAQSLQHKVAGLANIKVINNFIIPKWQQVKPSQQIRAQKFLHVSSMRAVKRPKVLLAAFHQLQQVQPNASLTIVTTKAGTQRFDQLLSQGIHNGIGIQLIDSDANPNALAEHYNTAQALVLTSQFEGFSLVVLEALQHHLPVIAPAVGALPEVLGHDWPFLLNPSDDQQLALCTAQAMEQISQNTSQQLHHRIKAIIDRFQGPEQINQYRTLYHHILSTNRG